MKNNKQNNKQNNIKDNKLSNLTQEAYERLKDIVYETPLERSDRLSKKYKANIFLKREDLQKVRSYKLRGAYNKIYLLSKEEKSKGIVCASAGNHAQGVAFSCQKLKVKGYIYMPKNTPKQKVERVKILGGKWISLFLIGDTFDDSYIYAKEFCEKNKKTFVHPFDDIFVMAGQGTVGVEILNQFKKINKKIDYCIAPVGGGGLIAGLSSYLKSKDENINIIGVEPKGAPSMSEAILKNKVITLEKIDKFIDGASVKTVGIKTFEASKKNLNSMIVIPEGKVCEEMISLYQSDGIITEPAGALSVSALDFVKDNIKGKNVICIISGGNNDISRYPEIIEKSLLYKGLKHYFLIEFSQRSGSLKEYLNHIIDENTDIVFFEYIKKNNKETGPALVGIELSDKKYLNSLIFKMNKYGISYEILDKESSFFKFVL